MGVLKTNSVHVREHDFQFKYTVNVTKEGLFSTTLPEDVATLFKNAGISMGKNRMRKPWYFSAISLDVLEKKVGEAVDEYFSAELIFDELMIEYELNTSVHYCHGPAGEIVPNGSWSPEGGRSWKHGTRKHRDFVSKPFGLEVYAQVVRLQKHKYRTGRVKTNVIHGMNHLEKEETTENLYWLSQVPGTNFGSKNVQYVPATEETAAMFVGIIKWLAKLSDQLEGKLSPETLHLLTSNQKLLS